MIAATITKQWQSTELELKMTFTASNCNCSADFRFSPVFQPFLLAKVQIMLEKYSIMLFNAFFSKSAFNAKFNAGIMCDTLIVANREWSDSHANVSRLCSSVGWHRNESLCTKSKEKTRRALKIL